MPRWMRYTGVLAMAAVAAGVFLAGQTGTHAESASTRAVSDGDKAPTTKPSTAMQRPTGPATSQPAKATTRPAASRPAKLTTRPSSPTVTVHYFHRTMRCATCRRLEELARQAVETGFAREIALGTVTWLPLDYQQDGNEHFVKDFNLEGPSLVLVKTKDGKQVEWRNMEKIWELVGNPVEYTRYVQDALRGYLYGNQAGRLP